MTTTVTITGTGTPQPHPRRAGPGVLVRHSDVQLQFDVGRGTYGRLLAAGTSVEKLSAIFLTHYHSDHLLGLEDLALSHWNNDLRDEYARLPVVAPNGSTTRFCERMMSIWDDDLAVRALHNHRTPEPKIDVVGFDVPDAPTEVWSQGDVRVIAGQVRHEPVEGAVGYRIETPDGVVVISGDTVVCDEIAILSEGADIVVYEAMRIDVIEQRPEHLQFIKHYHADTRQIGKQMAELNIPTLMLTHLIPAADTEAVVQDFVDDVRGGGYVGELMVCDDLDMATLG